MAIDPITAIANAISSVAGVALPYVQDHLRQKYEEQHHERLQKFQEIMSDHGPTFTAHLDLFVLRLLAEAGHPSGVMGDRTIRVPVDVFEAMVADISEGIKNQALLNNLQFKE